MSYGFRSWFEFTANTHPIMKTPSSICGFGSIPSRWLAIALAISPLLSARAGLNLEMQLYAGHYCNPILSTNATPPSPPNTGYFVWSPSSTISNGIYYQLTAANVGSDSFSTYYPNPADLIHEMTNGNWTLMVTNPAATNIYHFTVAVSPAVSGDAFTPVNITFPTYGAMNVTNPPTCTWTGPTNWQGTLYVQDSYVDTNGNYHSVTGAYLAANQTAWPCPTNLPAGTNSFYLNYSSNLTALVTLTPPTDSNAVALAGFTSQANLVSPAANSFTVAGPTAEGVHFLQAYYSFADGNIYATDYSSNQFNITLIGSSGGGSAYVTNVGVANTDAVYFNNNGGTGTAGLTPPKNLLATLAGSFSVSLWLKTTQVSGNNADSGMFGNAGIVSAFNGGSLNTLVIPMALTGSKLAFATSSPSSALDTLHSVANINTGSFVHLVVTRNQATGEKRIYVNGVLDNSDFGPTGWLFETGALVIGSNNGNSINGTLAEIQFYYGVLSAGDVQQLYQNPGAAIPDTIGNGVLAHYNFDGGTALAADVSGNGNNLLADGAFNGGTSAPATNADAIAGPSSVQFNGSNYLTAPPNLLTALAHSFSVSVWVNTTQSSVNSLHQNSDANGILAADVPGSAPDLIPVGLNASGNVVFNTGDVLNNPDDELDSFGTVNDGNWHHIVVTRDQATGEKNIYIDGALDSNDSATTAPLNAPVLLTIGALSDASVMNPNSPGTNGDNGYQGLLDDLQIYPRVLSTNEVAYLYDHPGAAIGSTAKPPVDATFHVQIVRDQSVSGSDGYVCFPTLDSVNVPVITQHTVESPNGWFRGSTGGSSSSYLENSLGAVLNECTNGQWKLTINQGDPSEQDFTFQMTIANLSTNWLTPVLISSPVNGSLNVPTNSAYTWSGPAGFSDIYVQTYNVNSNSYTASATLSASATSWVSPSPLLPGTNQFYVNYISNNVPFITTTTPVDVSANPVQSWSSTAEVGSQATVQFVVGTGPAPVQLVNVQRAGNAIQFSFLTQTGLTNIIETRTNLTLGAWLPLTNFVGDGTTWQFAFPTTNAPVQFYRVETQ